MDATIYIPTKGRVHRQETWSWMSPEWRERTYLVVGDEAEADELAGLGYPVLLCPEQGIGDTRQWVFEQHHVKADGRFLVMMDDDLRFGVRRTDDPSKIRQMDKAGPEWNEMMATLLGLLEWSPFCGIANRGGANVRKFPVWQNARIHDTYALDVAVARREGIRLNRVRFMEDFDAALQFLAKGYFTLTVNNFTKDDVGGSNAPGGCSTYRNAAGQAEAAYWLEAHFPQVVTAVTKKGWSGDMAAERVDVRVQWAKAYQLGCERRELLGIPLQPEPDILLL